MKRRFAPTFSRSAVWMALLLLVALLLAACASAPAAPAASDDGGAAEVAAPGAPVVNALGKELPADAAPLDQQVLVYPYSGWKTFTTVDFFQAV